MPILQRVFWFAVLTTSACMAQYEAERPPAVPLIVHDPYFSIWSASDRLFESATTHWTGKPNSLSAAIRVDGTVYRVMGLGRSDAPVLRQISVEVLPTRTLYRFEGTGIALQLTFFTPALPDDLDVLSRPLSYVEWTVMANDGKPHAVELYFDASAELAVNGREQPVTTARYQLDGQPVLRAGSREQAVLAKRGDDLRIDWGYLYLAADGKNGVTERLGTRADNMARFAHFGKLTDTDDFSDQPPPRREIANVLAVAIDLGSVNGQAVSRYVMLAYDDLYSIEYFERKLRPWWRRKGAGAADLLRAGREEHERLEARSRAFDERLMTDLRRAGGDEYARLAALAYRQTLGAHKLVADIDGTPLFFSKENFSNGCIDTVDVTYPSSPFFLLFNPRLLEAQLQPVLDYARVGRWHFPFAPHDLGTYPQANGQVYGGGEVTEDDQMPVEESGNMLLMLGALAEAEGNSHFAERYWPLLKQWAEYLRSKGLDPDNQLSTDDFAGHLAHNANLSIKAILALRSFALLAEMGGHEREAQECRQTAADFATKWESLAADGDHTRLAFDKTGTWSQKYNLVWDRLLHFNVFPAAVAEKEVAFYLTKQNRYGLPLDGRKEYTKLDWIVWTATLAEKPSDFRSLVAPLDRFVNESTSRVPLTDWFNTVTGKQEGFQARSVVGGVFIKMLADEKVWKEYAGRALAR